MTLYFLYKCVYLGFIFLPRSITLFTALTAGFAILAQSTFGVNSNMAMLTVIALVIALIADMTLLPALLIALDKDKKENTPVIGTKEASQNA